jgi:predicted ATP-binding protein involved in virulence
MRILRLDINGFRGFSDLSLHFPKSGPTVLTGKNGSGKTSILDCVAILLSAFIAQIEGREKPSRRYLFEDINTFKKEALAAIWLTSGASVFNFRLIGKTTQYQTVRPNFGASKEFLDYLETEKSFFRNPEEKLSVPVAIYYSANRFVDAKYFTQRPRDNRKLYDLRNPFQNALDGTQISFSDFFNWFKYREDIENENLRDNKEYRDKQLAAIQESIVSIMPGYSHMRVRRESETITLLKGDQQFSLSQLSDGEKSLVVMVADIARRLTLANPSSDRPLEGEGIILIDQVEQHLHPGWQRKIVPSLTRTFPNCHFIFTTHSPQVLSSVQPENICLLRVKDAKTEINTPQASFGRDSNYILEELLEDSERENSVKQKLEELFDLIDSKQLESAMRLRKELSLLIGGDESEFGRADVLLHYLESKQKS